MNLDNLSTFLGYIFSFDENHPLLFTQFYFWAFFALVMAVFCIVKNKLLLRNTFLFFASLFFYYKTCGLFVLLLLFATTTGFFVGKGIAGTTSKRKKKFYLFIGVFTTLFTLAYFKYAYFFTDVYNSLVSSNFKIINYLALWTNELSGTSSFDITKILLPVGISFYTFQVISYIVDIYRQKVAPVKNILDFGFYVSFFPQLVAGPIVRADKFIPQLYKPYHLSRRQWGIALFWILNGLAKKIILSDYLATNFIDRVFDNPLLFTGFENLMALFAYSLQVYADFSGYTDIAIGVAMPMGFYLPTNFNSPYKATNPGAFWKRWHISLSSWLKDYLYIPLGGNRKGKVRTEINRMLTMLLGGLWHGASWNFVIWGGLNGCGMLVYQGWKNITKLPRVLLTGGCLVVSLVVYQLTGWAFFSLATVWMSVIFIGTAIDCIFSAIIREKKLPLVNRAWSILLTFVFISFTRLFFRSGSNLDPYEANQTAWNTAKNMVHQIGGHWNLEQIPSIIAAYRNVFLLFLAGMIIHWLPNKFKRWYRLNFAMLPIWVQAIAVVFTVFVIYQFMSADLQPFIYFQF